MGEYAGTQTGDYIPRKDGLFAAWCIGFNDVVQASGPALGLTADDQARIALWTQRWKEAYQPAQANGSRTAVTVLHKKQMRFTVETIMREYAQQIKHTPGVPVELLIGAGLHLDDATRTRISRPVTAPMVSVTMQGLQHVVTYADQTTPTRKRKPRGVRTIQLYGYMGKTFTADYTLAHELGEWGRQPIRFDYLPTDAGLTMTYFGRWVTNTGLKGPWSLPKFLTIASSGCPVSMGDTPPLPFPERASSQTSSNERRAA